MKSLLPQYLASICVNLATLQSGLLMGWCSPSLPILLSKNSPLEIGPITVDEASLIASIYCLAGALGAFVFGVAINYTGRKYTLMLGGLLQTIGCILILIGENVEMLYISRCLSGVGTAGIFLAIPTFVAEISDKRIRGILGSFFVLSMNLGIVIGFVVGAFFNYNTIPIIGIVLGIIFTIWMSFNHETPLYLYSQQKIKAAQLSADFYNYELDLNDVAGKIVNKSDAKSNSITWNEIVEPATRKAITISLVLLVLSQYSGIFVFVTYAAQIFDDAGASLHPNIAAIIVGCLQLLGSYISVFLVDKAGRKFLLSFSSFGTCVFLLGMAAYLYLQYIGVDVSSVAWIPVLCLSGVVFISATGLRPIPFVLASEILPQKLRAPFLALIASIMWLFGYVFLEYFSYAVEIINLYGCMLFFAISTLLFLLFTLLFVPETKGKSLEEIRKILANK